MKIARTLRMYPPNFKFVAEHSWGQFYTPPAGRRRAQKK